jgi:hypothetical protein
VVVSGSCQESPLLWGQYANAKFFNQAGAAMVMYANRLLVILAALAVGVIFVVTVRIAGLHELAQRGHCASTEAGLQLQSCRAGDSSGSAD